MGTGNQNGKLKCRMGADNGKRKWKRGIEIRLENRNEEWEGGMGMDNRKWRCGMGPGNAEWDSGIGTGNGIGTLNMLFFTMAYARNASIKTINAHEFIRNVVYCNMYGIIMLQVQQRNASFIKYFLKLVLFSTLWLYLKLLPVL